MEGGCGEGRTSPIRSGLDFATAPHPRHGPRQGCRVKARREVPDPRHEESIGRSGLERPGREREGPGTRCFLGAMERVGNFSTLLVFLRVPV